MSVTNAQNVQKFLKGRIANTNIILLIVMLVMLTVSAAGCGQTDGNPTTGAAGTSQTTSATTASTATATGTVPHIASDIAGTIDDESIPENVRNRMKKSTGNLEPNPVVGIARGKEYAETTRKAVENAGGLAKIIEKGDVVLIKPNLVWPATGDSGTTTDYRIVEEIVRMVKECGAEKVFIGEGSPSTGVFEASKMNTIEGVELVDFNKFSKDECYYLKPANSQTGERFYIPKIYMDVDKVINVPKMKIHTEGIVTLSLKNASIGIPPTPFYRTPEYDYKYILHTYGLPNTIVDINQIRKPDFAIVDGIIGMEEQGPIGGKPVNSNVIIAGADPVAVDTVGLTFMGYDLFEVPHVVLAAEVELGICELEDIKIVGPELDSIKMKFKRSKNG